MPESELSRPCRVVGLHGHERNVEIARQAGTSKAEAAARFFTRRSFTTPAALAGTPALAVP